MVPAKQCRFRRFGQIAVWTACAVWCGQAVGADSGKSLRPQDGALVLVQGGSFHMGDVFGNGPAGQPETPIHEVGVDSFYIARHECTVSEFRRFVDATDYRTSAERHEGAYSQTPYETHWRLLGYEQADDEPVLQMSWNDAVHYCNWLSREEGLPPAYDEKSGALLDAVGCLTTDIRGVKGYRLPTEAEWEFAARERGKRVRFGNGEDIARPTEINFDASLDRYAYAEKGAYRKRSTSVGSFKPNALGLYDMSGNAWEWCTDVLANYPSEKRTNPYVPGDDPRILRGGSMGGDAKGVRVFSRYCFGRADHCGGTGFRIARNDYLGDARRPRSSGAATGPVR